MRSIRKMPPPKQNNGSKPARRSSKDNKRRGSVSNNLWKPSEIQRPDQINRLEGFYKQCTHPCEIQQGLLAIELGLQPGQIELWFQNKRTEDQAQNEKHDPDYSKLKNRMCEMLEKQNGELRKQICQKLGHKKCQLTCVERLKVDDRFLVPPVDNRIDIGLSNIMMLGNKVMKSYCSIFCLFGTTDLRQSSEPTNANVQIGFRKNTCLDHPVGIVIHAASSFWVSASPERVLNYLNDPLMRSQWDVFFKSGEVRELMQVPIGDHPSNVISILQPSGSLGLALFQEIMAGELASVLIYAPVDSSAMFRLVHGTVPATVPILSSGFTIAPDGSGSVITLAFQLLASTSTEDGVSMDMISNVKNLVSHIVNAIKPAFD